MLTALSWYRKHQSSCFIVALLGFCCSLLCILVICVLDLNGGHFLSVSLQRDFIGGHFIHFI